MMSRPGKDCEESENPTGGNFTLEKPGTSVKYSWTLILTARPRYLDVAHSRR